MMLANGIEQAVEDAGAEVVELDEEADYRKLQQLPQRIEVTSSLRNFVTILGSARNFDLSNYVADCRRRSKLKQRP